MHRLTPVRLTLLDAITRFDAASTASTIPNRKTGKPGPLKVSRRAPILSNVRKAVTRALAAVHGDRAIPDAVLERTDLTPYLLTLPEHGRLATRDDGGDPKAAGKVESNVRLFVSAVTGRDVVRDRQPVVRERVAAPYQPLYDTLSAHVEQDLARRRPLRRGFIRFVELATLSGARAPTLVPDDYATIMAWGERAGWKRKDTAYALNAWRCAVRLAGAPHALARDLVHHRGIGVRSLPDFPARLRAAGFTGDPATLTAAGMLPILAPKLAAPLERVITQGLNAGLSSTWGNDLRDMASWLVAALLRMGEDVRGLTWFDLWTVRRPVAVIADDEQDEQLAAYGIASTANVEHHSLIRRAMDTSARRSFELSHLWLMNPSHEADPVPVYTESLIGNLEAAFTVTRRFFGDRMQVQKPELWARATAERDAISLAVRQHNRGRVLLGRKAKDSLTITWPQMVCLGLPWLARQCYELRRQVQERQARIGHLESRESQELVNRYCDALFAYAVTALITDDTLRVKNYSGACAGEHVTVTPILQGGRWVGIATIRTAFTALDGDHVSLKGKKASNGIANERKRRVTPGIVDHTLWFDFWTLARPRRLVAAGLLPSRDAYDPTDDHFAVFPTPRPSAGQREEYLQGMEAYRTTRAAGDERAALPPWRGGMSEDMLSDEFGMALHRICVEVLHRDLPAWGSPELTKDYRGIFSGHIARMMAASYFGGARGNWAEAMYRTNDEEVTLRRFYVHLSAWAKEREHLEGPEGLRWFDAVIDRVLQLRSGDDQRWSQFWLLFDPMAPGRALEWLDRSGAAAEPRRRNRRVGRQQVSEAA